MEEEIGGSPYAIASYEISPSLGGDAGIVEFRRRLRAHGLKLILDFVPNHLGHDHPWLSERPELFVQGEQNRAGTFRQDTNNGHAWLAYGKDPYMGAWVDTVQLDYRNPATGEAMTMEMQRVAELCDGVRCDMAMLLLNEVFAKTWADFPSSFRARHTEFWTECIGAVRQRFPDFMFVAEVYWNLETQLHDLGFDFTYDKRLYDYLVAKNAAAVQQHLFEHPGPFVEHGAHFLENHDEQRIAPLLSFPEHRAAALLILGLPGLCLLHEGQLTGARNRLSVHLARGRLESDQADIVELYGSLLKVLQQTAVGAGQARLLRAREAWSGNPTHLNFVAIQWTSKADSFEVVLVNLAPHDGQCYLDLDGDDIADSGWKMTDLLGPQVFERDGSALKKSGLYVDVPAHAAQVFQFARQPRVARASARSQNSRSRMMAGEKSSAW
jgi:glycosidase